ncbi:hypothetical protein QQ045_003249 [Rhodiola kirilowii]
MKNRKIGQFYDFDNLGFIYVKVVADCVSSVGMLNFKHVARHMTAFTKQVATPSVVKTGPDQPTGNVIDPVNYRLMFILQNTAVSLISSLSKPNLPPASSISTTTQSAATSPPPSLPDPSPYYSSSTQFSSMTSPNCASRSSGTSSASSPRPTFSTTKTPMAKAILREFYFSVEFIFLFKRRRMVDERVVVFGMNVTESGSNLSPIVVSSIEMSSGGVSNGVASAGDDPYFVNKNELTGSSIVSKVMVGQDPYATWRKSMQIALSGRYKLGFIEGKYPKPDDVVMAARWQRCNDVVMSWLISSVFEKIVGEIIHAKDAMTAWEIL